MRSIWPLACSARWQLVTRAAGRVASRPSDSRARKSLEEFDFDYARGLKRDQVMHLGTLDFVAARKNVIFLGLSGTGMHCAFLSQG
jgi:DNA replication protein DnaC